MTADGLVQWCKDRLGQGYVYATYFDRVITEAYIQAKAKQYPRQYTSSYIQRSRRWIGHYAGDCVGLIKAYYWHDGDRVRYGYQGRADTSANGMLNLAKVKGNINTLPNRSGLFVHYNGHIGVYIGDMEVIESRGVDYGVVKTRLKDRPWTSWGEVPYIDYGSDEMRQGDKGSDVKLWQNRLIEWNKDALPRFGADADFGGETVEWTKRFQSAMTLIADGIVGASRWNAMVGQGDSGKVATLEIKVKALAAEVNSKSALLMEASNKLKNVRSAIDTLKLV